MVSSANRKTGKRLLALWLPRLSTDRILRQEKRESATEPLVLVAKIENALRLTAVTAQATRLGFKPGMPLANARAMVEELRVLEADDAADAKLLGGVADWCERFTPLVALDAPCGLVLDITGAAHLFGGERSLLDEARGKLTAQGFSVQAAIAGTPLAARALARYADGAIVSPGQEAGFVAPLPIAALDLESETAHGLYCAGLKTIGLVASRSRTELTARFGARLSAALDEALGKSEAPFATRRPLPEYLAERRFPEPILADDVIFETVGALAKALAELLVEHGAGARVIEAAFFRADGLVRRIAVTAGRPARDPKLIERLFRERLKSLADPLDCGFGFDLIRLEVTQAERVFAEAAGFEESASNREIGELIDRLAARFGTARVVRLVPRDTHIPEGAAQAVPAQHTAPAQLPWEKPDAGPARRPVRLLSAPEPIDVMAEVPDGPPIRFRWRRALHTIAFAAGPERIAMEWWRAESPQPTRDYFRVEDEEGARFWIFRSGLYGRETGDPKWYLHGLFA